MSASRCKTGKTPEHLSNCRRRLDIICNCTISEESCEPRNHDYIAFEWFASPALFGPKDFRAFWFLNSDLLSVSGCLFNSSSKKNHCPVSLNVFSICQEWLYPFHQSRSTCHSMVTWLWTLQYGWKNTYMYATMAGWIGKVHLICTFYTMQDTLAL